MNQEYLQGLSSDMDSPEDAVFFKATPHNIAAFLAAHRRADMSAIGTVDEKTFLTARMGLIDTCPDQEYLASKIIPAYSPCLMDPDKSIELETVPREVAQSAPCPQPDWNYLRWDGYSDEKYQAIQSGDGLLKLPWDGKTIFLDCQVRSYYNNGNLALLLQDWNNGEPEPWGDLTVNLGISLDQDCAFVDVNHLGQEILPWLEKEGLATPTGRTQQSGFVTYPEYRFNGEKLAKLDSEGYQMRPPGKKRHQERRRKMTDLKKLYQSELPSRAIAVYLYLRGRANKEGVCWPAIPTMARELKMSESTIRRALWDLVREGFLKVEERQRENGADSSHRYQI